MRWLWLAAFLICLAGCSKSSRNAPGQERVNGMVPPIQSEPNPGWDQAARQAPEVLYEGQPLSVWVEQFQQTTSADRAKAAQVLGQAGEEGIKPLLEGLKSNSEDLRLLALQSVTQTALTHPERQADTMNLLLGMLSDRNVDIRKLAVDRLGWYGKSDLGLVKKVVEVLRYTAKNDPAVEVRDVAESALRNITFAVTGKPVAGSPDDPKLPF
jgi:HEAT repeat protein